MTLQTAYYLSPKDVCQRLGVSERSLYRWVKSGRLTEYRLPTGHRRFAVEEVNALLKGPAA